MTVNMMLKVIPWQWSWWDLWVTSPRP